MCLFAGIWFVLVGGCCVFGRGSLFVLWVFLVVVLCCLVGVWLLFGRGLFICLFVGVLLLLFYFSALSFFLVENSFSSMAEKYVRLRQLVGFP